MAHPVAAQTPAAQTPAATQIVNVARAQYVTVGFSGTAASNPVAIRVDEVLGVALATSAIGAVHAATAAATPFTLTNRGNGTEAFRLDATITGTGASVNGFAIDSNGNGTFDAGVDVPIAQQGSTPAVTAGGTLALFVLIQGDDADATDTLTITARSITASGRPGTTVAGAGDGGSDAIVGPTTALATLTLPLARSATAAGPEASITKSQSVTAPGGGTQPVRGAVITYMVDATFAGSGIARTARLDDPLPPGTRYVPGSLRLDGAALTDTADADAGSVDGADVRVALGDVAAPAHRQLIFQVIIE